MFDYDTCGGGGGGEDGKPSQVNDPCFNMEMKINSETDFKTSLNMALTCYASGDFFIDFTPSFQCDLQINLHITWEFVLSEMYLPFITFEKHS